jgi:4'-phosphopantetheinyl transferase
MLYWLLQSEDAHPALSRGEPPPALLSDEEASRLAQFSSLSRRRDWLLGRWTAKRLLQQVAAQHAGYDVSLPEIAVDTASDGAPVTTFRQPITGAAYSLSLSHSHGYALCAVVEGHERPVGADLEWVTPRDDDFAAAFLSPEEQKLIGSRLPPTHHLRHLHVNAIWSAKEAVIKALRPRKRPRLTRIQCHIPPLTAEPQTWVPFPVAYPSGLASATNPPQLHGWWQTLGGFVLTMVTPAE